MKLITALCLLGFIQIGSAAGDFVVVCWNGQSNFDEANPTNLAETMAFTDGVDVWGLSEVDDDWIAELEWGAEATEGSDFESVVGTTGGNIRLAVIYDTSIFELVDSEELHAINDGNHRSPLVAQLRIIATGEEFLFMVNHLARGNEALRHQQATQLNDWAEAQTLPVIAVGDYNFDWHYRDGDSDHDDGYDNMTADGVFAWARPPLLVRTQHSDFDGVLDFVLTANLPTDWAVDAEIVWHPGDFPDNDETSDHRPIRANVRTSNGVFLAGPADPSVEFDIAQTWQVPNTENHWVNVAGSVDRQNPDPATVFVVPPGMLFRVTSLDLFSSGNTRINVLERNGPNTRFRLRDIHRDSRFRRLEPGLIFDSGSHVLLQKNVNAELHFAISGTLIRQ